MRAIILGLTALALAALAPAPAIAQAFDAGEDAQIRAIVRDYLIKNPEVIEEALQELEKKRARERSARIAADKRHFATGPANAPFVLIEFFDYQCGYCKVAADWVLDKSSARKDVRVIFVEFPILGPASVEASRAALAAIKQGRFLEMHRALMQVRGTLNSAAIDAAAKKARLDVARMRRDMADPGIDALLNDNMRMAQEMRIDGTPSFMVNGAFTQGADLAELERLLKAK